MKILMLDIETAPNTVYAWGIWQETIGINQIIDSSHVLCWAAKWFGDDKIIFHSKAEHSHRRMLQQIHKLLEEADVVVHYNGTRFDIPILNKEFITYDMPPPAPFKQVDLYRVARSRFKFVSNKLDWIAKSLGLGEKIRHKGFELWVECMEGNKDSWKEMEEYNRQDVVLLERLYKRFLPWIGNHPSHGLYSGLVCPNCGGSHYQRRGYAHTKTLTYVRFQCKDCHSWFRANKTITERGKERFIHVH